MPFDRLGQGHGIGTIQAQRHIKFTLNRLDQPAESIRLLMQKCSGIDIDVMRPGIDLLTRYVDDKYGIPLFNSFLDAPATRVNLLPDNDHGYPRELPTTSTLISYLTSYIKIRLYKSKYSFLPILLERANCSNHI